MKGSLLTQILCNPWRKDWEEILKKSLELEFGSLPELFFTLKFQKGNTIYRINSEINLRRISSAEYIPSWGMQGEKLSNLVLGVHDEKIYRVMPDHCYSQSESGIFCKNNDCFLNNGNPENFWDLKKK